jgi:hypothetical protein
MENSEDTLSENLLLNGLDYICEAIRRLADAENAESADKDIKSILRYSLLHLLAGTDLVLKYRLFSEHWTYIFADMDKADKSKLKSGDINTVSDNNSIDRLERLCGISIPKSEKVNLTHLRKKRNRAEHIFLNEDGRATRSTILKSIPWVIDLLEDRNISTFSSRDSRISEYMHAIRSDLLAMERTKKLLMKRADGLINRERLNVLTCPDCGEDYLTTDGIKVECKLCGYKADGRCAANLYVENIIGLNSYYTYRDGGVWPVFRCPECDVESLVVHDQMCCCFSCGEEFDEKSLSGCSECGRLFLDLDHDGTYCDPCWDYKTNKDD